MRDYAKITTKEDSKQVKLAGKNLENAMNFLNGMMMEIKLMKMEHSEKIPQLDDDIRDCIKKLHHILPVLISQFDLFPILFCCYLCIVSHHKKANVLSDDFSFHIKFTQPTIS